MITNERQYAVTKVQAENFRDALKRFSEIDLVRQGIDPVIIAAQRASLEQQLADLESDLTRYAKLRSGATQHLPLASITDIGLKLIEARIVQGLSQRELGDRLGMKEQQVQRYEQDRYLTANLTRCAAVAEALGLNLNAYFDIRQLSLFDWSTPDQRQHGSEIAFDPTKLPVKEMKRRGWLSEIRFVDAEAYQSDRDLAATFIREASRGRQMASLHKQHIRAGSIQDEHALLAWRARVLWKARQLDVVRHHRPSLDMAIVRQLAELSERTDGPQGAVALLREQGVAVVFEEHFPQTHLDGAAMLLDDHIPVIGLTLRWNRLDSFWFVLLHECAHILLHADRGLRDGFFDEEGAPAREAVEKEADEYARNALIPSEVWKGSLVRFSASTEQVLQFAKNHKVGVPVVAGRIRRERNDYTLFSDLVGQGEAKKQILTAGLWEQ